MIQVFCLKANNCVLTGEDWWSTFQSSEKNLFPGIFYCPIDDVLMSHCFVLAIFSAKTA